MFIVHRALILYGPEKKSSAIADPARFPQSAFPIQIILPPASGILAFHSALHIRVFSAWHFPMTYNE